MKHKWYQNFDIVFINILSATVVFLVLFGKSIFVVIPIIKVCADEMIALPDNVITNPSIWNVLGVILITYNNLNNTCEAIIAYDCQNPSTNMTVISVKEVASCPDV